jgi:hypothetical protein
MVSVEALEALKERGNRRRGKKGGGALRTKALVIATAEAAGGAAVVGYLRGKAEADSKEFKVFGIDGELVIGAALLALPMVKQLKKLPIPIPKNDLVNIGMGVLASYAGTIGREFGGTGKTDWRIDALSYPPKVAGYYGNVIDGVSGGNFIGTTFPSNPYDYGAVAGNEGLWRATSFDY